MDVSQKYLKLQADYSTDFS